MTSNQNNIYPKSCNYGCNTQIYWNISENTYFEVFTKKRHKFQIDLTTNHNNNCNNYNKTYIL